jgi:hypothetical protein
MRKVSAAIARTGSSGCTTRPGRWCDGPAQCPHVVWHSYAQELEPEPVQRLLGRPLKLWPAVEQHLEAFDGWLLELKA